MPKAEVPVIVAELEFLNQTATLPLTTVYSVAATGFFQITCGGSQSVQFPSGALQLNWTDEYGSHSVNLTSTATVAPTANGPQTFAFRAIGGTDITVQGVSTGAFTYNLDIILEAF
jgi:hypothetical protein